MLCVHLIEKQHNEKLKMTTAKAIAPQASLPICVVSVLVSYPEHIEKAYLYGVVAPPKAVLVWNALSFSGV